MQEKKIKELTLKIGPGTGSIFEGGNGRVELESCGGGSEIPADQRRFILFLTPP
jgi:hypothetical protein